MQSEVILDLAKKETCIIVGRCADYILKDKENCLKVFIYASLEEELSYCFCFMEKVMLLLKSV